MECYKPVYAKCKSSYKDHNILESISHIFLLGLPGIRQKDGMNLKYSM